MLNCKQSGYYIQTTNCSAGCSAAGRSTCCRVHQNGDYWFGPNPGQSNLSFFKGRSILKPCPGRKNTDVFTGLSTQVIEKAKYAIKLPLRYSVDAVCVVHLENGFINAGLHHFLLTYHHDISHRLTHEYIIFLVWNLLHRSERIAWGRRLTYRSDRMSKNFNTETGNFCADSARRAAKSFRAEWVERSPFTGAENFLNRVFPFTWKFCASSRTLCHDLLLA